MPSPNEGPEDPLSADLTGLGNPASSWLLDLFRSSGRAELLGIALLVGGLPFLLGLAVAVEGGFVSQYLTAASVYLWTAGLFGGALTFGWWGNRYPDLWMALRPTFDVSKAAYRDVVRAHLTRMFDLRRALVAFVVLLVLGVLYDHVVGFPALISYATLDSGSVFRVSAVNYVFGFVTLLGLAIAFHVVFTHLRLVEAVMDLPLETVHSAAVDLQPVARFNNVISAGWFVSLTLGLLLLWVHPRLTTATLLSGSYYGGVPLLQSSVVVLILVGFLLFVVPQYAMHAGIKAEKLAQLHDIDRECAALYDEVVAADDGTDAPDEVSLRLDVLETRRQNLKETQTWTYDVKGMLSLVASSVVPIVSLFV